MPAKRHLDRMQKIVRDVRADLGTEEGRVQR
jgi:hypothetical protein